MKLPKELPELIEDAVEFTDAMKADLDARWYAASDVELSIRWLSTMEVKATASVEPSLETVEQHVVSLSYGLLDCLYSVAFEFARFTRVPSGEDHVHGTIAPPQHIDILETAELMFMVGLMFVFYHEIGHLNQGHGSIRALYGDDPTNGLIDDFEEAEVRRKVGDAATISHATEFAADFEAQDWMVRHLSSLSGDEAIHQAYLQCAMVSCTMLLFNGDQPVQLDSEPLGTHPYPVVRMDIWIQGFTERIALLAQRLQITEDRAELSKRFSDAGFLALLSWLTRNDKLDSPPHSDFCKGLPTHPNFSTYMRHVINSWSRHDELARAARRYGWPMGVLYFTDEYRARVEAEPNRDSFVEHLEKALQALAPGGLSGRQLQ
ncbi:hypothetical protein [Achromobacter sp. NFACC18-2]|uniref:hypothetical protein n=1 Tax=Achromobacter sp. NFACC18-2 TaxID=1564112 RepID=UPI0008C93C2D|nr:hypothetical protein [Achromobacter sp. NFACC18-2]SEJ07081.1 hypothetical protein SAMN03159494_01592 [Achromobacter sp. NFACC18-2]